MRRLRDERGATSVMVAVLMVPLIGFAALAVDVAAMWAERQELQSGADAAALAVAQDCARARLLQCGLPQRTAQDLASANVRDAVTATVLTFPLLPTTGKVRIRTTGNRQHVFAPLIGTDSTEINTEAAAGWGAPSAGIAQLPLIFSWCEFLAQTGGGLPSLTTERVIKLTKSSGVLGCTGPSNNVVPGGFGWLTTDPGSCRRTSAIKGIVYSEPGNSVPSSCSPADLTGTLGKTVLLPVFDDYGGSGSNAWYRIYGYAAFTITGYHFAGQFTTNPVACHGNDRCLIGYFTRFVDLTEAFKYSTTAPQLGASVITLTE